MKHPSAFHLPALDGLRALAVVMVMLYHFGRSGFFQGGYIGVDVFFVLSGYLITTLILREKQRAGAVDFAAFYARRALRLLPGLSVVALFSVLVVQLPAMAASRAGTMRGLPYVALYAGSWANSMAGNNALGLLSHTWSLAIEEQFYLLWPVTLMLSLREWSLRSIGRGLAALVFGIWVIRASLEGLGVLWAHLYYSSGAHCDGLLLGSALAVTAPESQRRNSCGLGSCERYLPPLALALLITMGLLGDSTYSLEWTAFVPLAMLATAVLVHYARCGASSVVFWLLSSKPAIWVGRRSYGLYLWHVPIYATLGQILGRWGWREAAMAFLMALAVESVCYEAVELPMLRLKARMYGSLRRPPDPDGHPASLDRLTPVAATTEGPRPAAE